MEMNNEPVISVIVITYNQETTIARAIDSVLAQRCNAAVEIVIGEDGSTDGTRAICEDYVRRFPSKVRLMAKAPNKGVVDNYFDCLLACRGKYIADCAGDDFWTDNLKLDKELRIMETHPRVTLVHTDWLRYDETTKTTTCSGQQPFADAVTDGKTMLEAIITQTDRPVIHLCTALYRASTIKKAYAGDTALFRNKDFGCEDLQICFAMARMGDIAYIPDSTLCYSCGKSSVSFSEDGAKQFRFVRQVTSLSFYLSERYDIRGRAVERYFSRRLTALLMHAFRCGSSALRDEAVRCGRLWHARKTPLSALVTAVTSNRPTWIAALKVRAVVVRMKSAHA